MNEEDFPGFTQDVELDSPKLNSKAAEEFEARSFQRINRNESSLKSDSLEDMREHIRSMPRPRTIRVLGDRFYQLVDTLPELTTGVLAMRSNKVQRRGLLQWIRSLF